MIYLLSRSTIVLIVLLGIFPRTVKGEIQSEALLNGMDVITIKSPKVPLVTIVLSVKAGSFTEKPETNGLTHLWEHMFFKGNALYRNQESFNHRINELGIVYNGDTNPEVVRYYITLPAIFMEEGLNFMYNAIATPLIDFQELANERRVVLDEWDRFASQPRFDLTKARLQMIYGKYAYARYPLGERSIIEYASREQLLQIKDEVFVPKNTALIIAGDFNSDKAHSLIRKIFNNWRNPADWVPVNPPVLPEFPNTPKKLIKLHAAMEGIELTVTFKGPNVLASPMEIPVADVLESMVNQKVSGFSKRFIDSGLAYRASFRYLTQAHAGELNLSVICSANTFSKTYESLTREAKEWAKLDAFSSQNLEDAKSRLLINRKFATNRPSSFALDIAFWWAITGLNTYNRYILDVNYVSLETVTKFVKRYLSDRSYIITILTSPENAKLLGLKDNVSSTVKIQ